MFTIHAKKSGGNWQVIDTAETEVGAMRIYGEHRIKLGPEWLMCMTERDAAPLEHIEWVKEDAP